MLIDLRRSIFLSNEKGNVSFAFLLLCHERKWQVLTQADVVGERVQEPDALLPLVAAHRTAAPWRHAGRGVVHVVGGHRAP